MHHVWLVTNVRSILVFILLYIVFTSTAYANLVASTPGEFSVSSTGAANYSVPIVVPPGTAGVEPKLSLNYSSQGRNGLLGVGWSIGGLSVIHRCPTNLVKDGFIDGIDFDENDRFCIDGQPLIAVDSNGNKLDPQEPAYGADGTEYRTEINNFSKIVSYGDTGNGPSYFKVWTKSGEVMEYGNTSNSLINPPNADGSTQPDAICWLLNRVTDTVGNYMTITYFEDETTGENYPDRIDYTGNASESLTPYNSVEFSYETRTDTSTRYLAGLQLDSIKRLKTITSKVGTNKVREYEIQYLASSSTNRSLLANITDCDNQAVCTSGTVFNWEQNNLTLGTASQWLGPNSASGNPSYSNTGNHTWYADMNGDGLPDQAWVPKSGNQDVWVALSTGNSFATPTQWLGPNSANGNPSYSNDGNHTWYRDMNGDGLTDQAWVPIASNENVWVALSTGSGFTTPTKWLDANAAGGNPSYSNRGAHTWYADMNGDGLPDQAWVPKSGNQDVWVAISTGSSFATPTQWLGPNSADGEPSYSTDGKFTAYVDVNGDGLPDQVWVPSFGDKDVWVALSTGSSFDTPTQWLGPNAAGGEHSYSTDGKYTSYADVNGDGLADQVWVPSGGDKDVWVALSTGNSFATPTQWLGPNAAGGEHSYSTDGKYTSYVDINGDGLTDQVWTPKSGDKDVWAALSTGSSFDTPTQWLGPNAADGDPSYSNDGNHTWFRDMNGDGLPDQAWVPIASNQDVWVSLVEDAPVDVLIEIENSLGVSIEIDYTPITDNTIYTKGSGASFPEIDMQTPLYVVSESRTDNGIGGQNTLTYAYEGAKVHVQGRGLLGFAQRTVTDVDTNIVIETNYNQSFPYIGQVESTKTTVDGTLVSEEINTFASLPASATNGPAFPYANPAVSKTYDLNGGALLTTVTTNSTYDTFGNPTNITVTTNDVGIDTYTTTTVNTYTNDTTKWHLGRLTQAVVTKTGGAQSSPARTSTFEYDSATGLLTKETIEPNSSFELIKTYTHDSFGNRDSVTESGTGITSRTTTTNYDSKGQFPVTITNDLGHIETRGNYDAYGNPGFLTGPNDLTTTWEYDTLGRKKKETRADGTVTDIAYEFCGACPSQVSTLASYKITTTTTGSATSTQYYDAVNRVILTETESFDGTSVFAETKFDAQGRVDERSNPYFGTTTTYWTEYEYDELGRVTQEISPTTGTTSMAYSGFMTTVTNDENQTSKEQTNSLGQTLWTEDDNQNQLEFEYDAQGNLISVTDSEDNVTSNTYNLRGFKTQMVDPDMGTWTYSYNALGELTSQTDAKSQTVSMTYDTLGRLLTRTESEGTTTWTYDNCTKGKGKLCSVSHYGGYSRTHTYDTEGRPSSTTTTISGTSYTTTTTYDGSGRVEDVTYPSTTNFKVEHVYNTWGYLQKVRNANNASEEYYFAQAADHFGNITTETLGHGAGAITTFRSYQQNSGRIHHIDSVVQDLEYTFDNLGNLTQRKDHDQTGLTEDFTYDNLNRLKTANVVGAGTVTFTYDDLGNITNKSDVGNYSYGAGNAGPHAVTNAGGITYTYDNNGNQISGDGKTITWSSYNKPTLITKGGSSSAFTYGPDRARYLQVTDDGTDITTTTYIGGLYEKVEIGSETKEKHFIRAGSQTIAIYTTSNQASDTTEYLHRDHLGSIDTITDASGMVVDKLSFDAFGKRRLSNWNAGVPVLNSLHNTRGFTGHEMLDAVGLIHMNGRVYDPLLGRFMSADPTLQYPKDMQNYNRYSYVHNNPLSLTDPSGFGFLKKILKKAFKLVVPKPIRKLIEKNTTLAAIFAIATAAFTGGLTLNALGGALTATNLTIAGAIGGFAGGFVGSGGDLKASIVGGLTGAAAGFIGSADFFKGGLALPGGATSRQVIAHGVVGGTAAEAQGGKFGQGFLSSAFTKAVSNRLQKLTDTDPVAGGIAAGIVGGTISKISGGKFQNGALTTAFQYLFNQYLTARQKLKVLSKLSDDVNRLFSRYSNPSNFREDFDLGNVDLAGIQEARIRTLASLLEINSDLTLEAAGTATGIMMVEIVEGPVRAAGLANKAVRIFSSIKDFLGFGIEKIPNTYANPENWNILCTGYVCGVYSPDHSINWRNGENRESAF